MLSNTEYYWKLYVIWYNRDMLTGPAEMGSLYIDLFYMLRINIDMLVEMLLLLVHENG